ncbi:MAG: hypothetical protein K8T90_09375 [Planctomycetes bacterium]|nr:hypothetical protein [Planctomycetota bacterium]
MSSRFKLPDPDDCVPPLLRVAALILLIGVAFVVAYLIDSAVRVPRSVDVPTFRDGRLVRDPNIVIRKRFPDRPEAWVFEMVPIADASGASDSNAPVLVNLDSPWPVLPLIRPVNWPATEAFVMYRLDSDRVTLVRSSGLCLFEWDSSVGESYPGDNVSVLALVVGEGSFVPEDVDAVVERVRGVRERVAAGTLGLDVFFRYSGATFEDIPTDADLSACLRTGVPAAAVVVRELAAAGGTVLYPRTSAALGK